MQSSARLWLIAISLSIGPAVTNGLGRFAYGLILPAMRDDLGWSYTEAGWINTANAMGYLLGALLALRIMPRLGPTRLFVSGMVLTALALILSGLTTNFWLLTLWRILAGVGGAPVFIAGGAMVSTLFKGDASRNALAISVYFGGGGLGMLLSGVPIPIMLDRMTSAAWPQTWLLLGVMSCAALVPTWWSVRALGPSVMPPSKTAAARLPIRDMAAALTGYFLFAIGYIVYVTFLVAWMRAQGAGTAQVVLTWALLGIGVMLSPFPWRRILASSSGGAPLALSCAVTGVGTLLPLFFGGPTSVFLSAAVFGLAFFIPPAAITSFGRKNLAETQWGTSVALFTTVFAIGQMIGPVAAGAISDHTNSITLGLLSAGLILLLGAIVATTQRPLTRN